MEHVRLRNITIFNFSILLFLTLFCVISFFIWEGHLGINLSDEAFIWYGAQAVHHGQVPIRDFYAYDPGRYYLTALIMKLLGNDGIIASRIAEAIVETIGLFLALFMLVTRLKLDKKFNFIYMSLTALILLIWMAPLYKIFDITSSIVLIAMLTYLIETNTLMAYFWAGVCLGSIAIIGRNHGVYGAVASAGVLIYLRLTSNRYSFKSALQWWFAGLMTGYMPILLMLLFIPGFSYAFFKSIYFIFMSKATNLYLPIPWPWLSATPQGCMMGLFFILILLFAVGSVMGIILNRSKTKSPLFIACAFLAFPYAHYAYSRADIYHLALGIFPFLIGIIAYIYQRYHQFNYIVLLSLITVLSLSMITASPLHPGIKSYNDEHWQWINITGSQLKVDQESFQNVEMFRHLINLYAQNNQSFLVLPFNFGMYPIFGRTSPMWDLYPLFPRSFKDQAADIAKIENANPGFVVIYDFALDGDEKRRFHHTHSIIYKYIVDHFELTQDASIQDVYVYKRKN